MNGWVCRVYEFSDKENIIKGSTVLECTIGNQWYFNDGIGDDTSPFLQVVCV